MTGVSATNSDYSYEEYLKVSRTPNQELGQSEFLALLVAQLQYQDPLEPMSDTDFVAQLAQFSSLSMLQSISASVSTSAAYSLAGKLVLAEFMDGETGEKVSVLGTVSSIMMVDGTAYATVSGYMVPLDAIVMVYDPETIDPTNPVLDKAVILGKTVIGTVPEYDDKGDPVKDEDGKVVTYQVEGKVTRIAVDEKLAAVVAYVEDENGVVTKVPVANIIDIRD